MGNNFEVVQCTLLKKYWESGNNGVNVNLKKYGKGGGSSDRTSLPQFKCYFDAGLFICSLFACLFLSSFVRFLFLFHLIKWATLVWMGYRITQPVSSCLHLFVKCTSIVWSVPVKRNLTSHCSNFSKPTPLSQNFLLQS